MNYLNNEGLNIEIKDKKNQLFMIWKGKSRSINPGKFLDPYFDKTLKYLDNKDLVMDFSNLDTMNSSTVSIIISFIKNLEITKINTKILYNNKKVWQKASFLPLASITNKYKYVEIKSI